MVGASFALCPFIPLLVTMARSKVDSDIKCLMILTVVRLGVLTVVYLGVIMIFRFLSNFLLDQVKFVVVK